MFMSPEAIMLTKDNRTTIVRETEGAWDYESLNELLEEDTLYYIVVERHSTSGQVRGSAVPEKTFNEFYRFKIAQQKFCKIEKI